MQRFIARGKVLMLAMSFSLIGGLAQAQQPPQGGQNQGQMQAPLSPPDALRLPIFKKRKLDKKQKAAVQEIQKNNQSSFDAYRDAMHRAKHEFDQSMDSNDGDDVVRQRFRAFQQASDAFMNSGFEQALAIRKILTPKQREKFRELKAKMFERVRREDQQYQPAPPPEQQEEDQ